MLDDFARFVHAENIHHGFAPILRRSAAEHVQPHQIALGRRAFDFGAGLRVFFQKRRERVDKRFAAVLIDAGASVRAKNAFGISSLLIAAEYSQNPDIVSLLLASYSATENDVAKAFIHAITSSNVPLHVQCEKIRRFIAKGVPLNVFYEGKTPLMYAASSASSTAVIAVLLESGALPFARTAEGLRAFDFAKKNQALEKDAVYRSLNTDN